MPFLHSVSFYPDPEKDDRMRTDPVNIVQILLDPVNIVRILPDPVQKNAKIWSARLVFLQTLVIRLIRDDKRILQFQL